MILNIKVFTREFMHYVLQGKICNTIKYKNTRKRNASLEEAEEEGRIFSQEEGRKHFSGN